MAGGHYSWKVEWQGKPEKIVTSEQMENKVASSLKAELKGSDLWLDLGGVRERLAKNKICALTV